MTGRGGGGYYRGGTIHYFIEEVLSTVDSVLSTTIQYTPSSANILSF